MHPSAVSFHEGIIILVKEDWVTPDIVQWHLVSILVGFCRTLVLHQFPQEVIVLDGDFLQLIQF